MYYCFDKDTRRCNFSSNTAFEDMSSYIVIESDRPLSISRIMAVKNTNNEWEIEEQAYSALELAAAAKAKRLSLLKIAQDNLSLLKDLVDMGVMEEDDEKIIGWKEYRKHVYLVSTDMQSDIVWPTMPERDV